MLAQWLKDVVKHRGTAQALVLRDTYLSFRGLWHRARRRAQELAGLGVGRGDIVGIMLGNVADYLILAAAANLLEAVVLPLDPLSSSRELELCIALIPVRALITRPGAAAAAKERAMLRIAEKAGRSAECRRRLQGSLLACSVFTKPTEALAPADAVIVHLMAAKGGALQAVYRSPENISCEAQNVAHAMGVTENSRVAVSLPFHHAFSLESSVAFSLGYGGLLHVDDDLSAARLMRRVRDNKLNLVPVTQSLLKGMITLPTTRPFDHEVRIVCVDGAVTHELSKELYRVTKIRAEGALHLAHTGLMTRESTGKSPRTAGLAVDGLELRIVDSQGKKKAANKEGSLVARGPGVSSAIVCRQPDGTIETIGSPKVSGKSKHHPWGATGVRGKLDAKGRLVISGRDDDLVSIEGTYVSLEEVRAVLLSHPEVEEATVLLQGEQKLAEPNLVAELVVRGKISPHHLLEFCGKHLSPLKIPSDISILK